MEMRRKLYKRGSSFETTIPKPLLFALDSKKKYEVVFNFDERKNKWYVSFEEAVMQETKTKKAKKNKKRGKK